MRFRHHAFRAMSVAVLVAAMLPGCGSGGASGEELQSRASLRITVLWPNGPTRLIPFAARSLRLTLSSDEPLIETEEELVRSPDTEAEFANVIPGRWTLTATAHESTDGTGTPLATATQAVDLLPVVITQVGIALDSTIDRFAVTPAVLPLVEGASGQLVASAKNANGDLVPLPDVVWSVLSGGDKISLPGGRAAAEQSLSVTAIHPGEAVVQVAVSEGPGASHTATARVVVSSAAADTGDLEGSVRDALTGQPLAGVSVGVAPIGTGTSTIGDGTYRLQNLPVGTGYTIHITLAGYLPAEVFNVVIEPDATTFVEAVLQIDDTHGGLGSTGGVITDALTGLPVADVQIVLRAGVRAVNGPVITTTTTDGGGHYGFADLPAGHYTAELSKSGYTTSHFTVLCLGGISLDNQNGTIVPETPTGEVRIVLTWGEHPSDLDSHLTGPSPITAGERFHVFYADPLAPDGVADLDVDDVTSYGPETVTLHTVESGELYRYSVHDYSNREYSDSQALSQSGVQVKVYIESTLVRTFDVPPARDGTLWTVFEMIDGVFTPVNELTYESEPSTVRSRPHSDFELLRSLPAKL